LKPDNILVGNITLNEAKKELVKSKNKPELNNNLLELMQLFKLRFIDFGLVTRFLDDKGEHIKDGISDKFKGSMLFASKNSFKFLRTSRRDDLISLVYILIFMMDIDRLKFINEVEGIAKKEKFKIIKD
jgi:serine/threonine protein kinase